MLVAEDQVREALKQVIDPELFVNIVDLGLIYTVTVEPAGAAASPAVQDPATPEPAAAVAAPPAGELPVAADAPAAEEKSNVKIEMTMTSPACPAGPQLLSQSKSVVGALAGVASVEVKLVMTPPWTPDRMTEDARDQLGIF
jgi:metal-sulfur cluster biosynthetic enzyme